MPSRIACLVVPDLPLAALLRADPSLHGLPVAVTAEAGSAKRRSATPPGGVRAGAAATTIDGRGAAPAKGATGGARSTEPPPPPASAPLIALSTAAYRMAVRPGMTVSQARALCPGLVVRAAQAEAMAAAGAALFDAGLGFAPRAEAAGEVVYVEVGDLGRLYASELELGIALRGRARSVGLEAGVGLAGSKGVARLAAWSACVGLDATTSTTAATGGYRGASISDVSVHEGVCVVRGGAEARFAGRLPLPLLARASGLPGPVATALCESLARWGVESAERLSRLPGREVALRLGEMGARLHRLAGGVCDEPLAAAAPPDECEEGMELDFTIHEVEPLAFVLRGLLDRLLDRLGARHLACAGLVLRLRLDGGGHDVREIPVAAPTREAASLLQLIRLDVERRPPPAGIIGASLVTRAACARLDQLDLFRPAGPSPEKLATTLARLEALCGPQSVGSPRAAETHREEAYVLGAFLPMSGEGERGHGHGHGHGNGNGNDGDDRDRDRDRGRGRGRDSDPPRPALALRRFRPERPVEVLLDGGSTPRALRGEGISCHVVIAAGPFRVQGEWWDQGGFARDYWDVHASDGALYRLYRDRAGAWLVAGYYD